MKTPPGPEFMRPMRALEEPAVAALLCAAFPGPEEAGLVAALRAEGRMEAEFVMPWADGLAGYLAFSRMLAPEGWLALAPVAIAPDWQGRHIGTRMVAGAMRLMAIKGLTVVVLGKPSFYARCGFSSARAAGLTSPYPINHTLIARPGDDTPEETLLYPPAFKNV